MQGVLVGMGVRVGVGCGCAVRCVDVEDVVRRQYLFAALEVLQHLCGCAAVLHG